MNMNKLYKYTLSGALETLRVYKHLYEMCLDNFDEDMTDKCTKKIAEVTKDIGLIHYYLGDDM